MSVFQNRIDSFKETYNALRENDRYYYLQQIDELDGAHVHIGGRRMVMFSSYSYLGLLKHPRVQERARQALDHFGSGTHGVRILATDRPTTAWSSARPNWLNSSDTRMQ